MRAFSTLGRQRRWQAGTRVGRVRGNTGKTERQAYTQADGETSMEAGRVRGNTGKNERQAGRRKNMHGGRQRGVARMYTDRGM